jgi:hypothetical protein
MAHQNLEADVRLTLKTWSALHLDNGAIWKRWNDKLTEAKKSWDEDYAKLVFETARSQWLPYLDNLDGS